MRDFDRPRLAARQAHAHALCAYAEPLARGHRVLVVADPALDLGARLTSLGARSVHLYTPSPIDAAAENTANPAIGDDVAPTLQRGAVVRALPAFDRGADFDVRDGAYDFAFVPDLGAVADPSALLARLRRILGSEGALLAGARNPDRSWSATDRRASRESRENYRGPERRGRAIAYADLYDLASLQFASIRMLAQMPFRGLVIAELGLEEGETPDVSVDTQVADEAREGRAADPHFYFVLAAQRDVRLDAYAVLQLPDVDDAASTPSVAPSDSADVAALAAAQLRADVLLAQLEAEKASSARIVEARHVSEARHVEGTSRVAELEVALATKTQAAAQAEARAAEHYARTERITGEVARLDDELGRERQRVLELTALLAAERRERESEEVLAATERDRGILAEAAARVMALETALAEAELVAAAYSARATAAEEALELRTEQLEAVLAELEDARAIATAVAAQAAESMQAVQALQAVQATEAERARRSRESESARASVDPAVLDALAARATQAESIIAELETDLANVGELHADELTHLEKALQERGQALQSMEREVTRRDRLVQELVAALEAASEAAAASSASVSATSSSSVSSSASSSAPRSELSSEEASRMRAKLEHLSMEIARREGELEARAWRIAELEREVTLAKQTSQSSQASAPVAASSNGGAAAWDEKEHALRAELDALRQALAQEHAAKVQAESGEKLEEARAELARQAVLIDQLSRQLQTRTD